MTDADLPAELLARRALTDSEHAAAGRAVGDEAARTPLVRLLGVELAIRLQAGFRLRTVADLNAFVLGYREKELRAKESGLKPAEAAKAVRALGLWWEPRFLGALARIREGGGPSPQPRQRTLWNEAP